jgi:Asp-tRNA(Asn)/Glu-tRNA(Gln) amidotransferase A subunit family amidase
MLSADELSARLDDGLMSATELLECFLDRHRQINPEAFNRVTFHRK